MSADKKTWPPEDWQVLPESDVRTFIQSCLVTVGTSSEHAQNVADVLVMADRRGVYSHGINRMAMYTQHIKSGIIATDAQPEVLKEKGATAWVDGHNCLGHVVGTFCMDLAMKKAKDFGVGWVVAKGSNHFGIAGYYSTRAADAGLLGMAFTSTPAMLIPTRSRSRGLGTNPIAVAAKGKNEDCFDLDMATTGVAQGKLEIAIRRGQAIPDGWGTDDKGQMCNDPAEIRRNGGLLPLGGMEQSGGYKGYGLAMMVEVLCGVTAGSAYGTNIRKFNTSDREANFGHCFVAVNPECFAPGFEDRMSDLIQQMHGLELAENETEVLVPGEPEKKHCDICKEKGGIPYHPSQIIFIRDMAQDLGVDVPPCLLK